MDEFEARHVQETAAQLMARSTAIAERVAAGTLAIICLTYRLAEGPVVLRDRLGNVGEHRLGAVPRCDDVGLHLPTSANRYVARLSMRRVSQTFWVQVPSCATCGAATFLLVDSSSVRCPLKKG